MERIGDYRFQINPDFYELLHKRLDEGRVRENRDHRSRGGFIGRRSRQAFMAAFLPDLHGPELIPSRDDLAEIVDTAFWASLGKEERRAVRFKMSYRPNREVYNDAVDFVQPLRYSVASIVKLAPSCGDYGHLLIAPSSKGLEIFGRATSSYSFFGVKAIDPGQLVLEAGTWNIAAISGSEVVFIRNGLLGIYGEMWDKLGDWRAEGADPEIDTRRSVLVNVARSMRRLGHGGAVIIVPDNDDWRHCVSEIAYESRSQPGELRNLLNLQADEVKNSGKKPLLYADYVELGINDLAALTKVDGAVLIRPDLSLIGFGAKLIPGDQNPLAEVYEVDPLDHNDPYFFRVAESLGGTRHHSAARFVQDNPAALAIVVSEDGIVSCFASQPINKIDRVVRYKRLELTLF